MSCSIATESQPSSPPSLRAVPPPLAVRIGFDIHVEFASSATMLLMLYAHPDVAPQLEHPSESICIEPGLAIEPYTDPFGNRCARVAIPAAGIYRLAHETVYHDVHAPEAQPAPDARQHEVQELPTDVLPYLLGSRYCEVDRLSALAWDLFGKLPTGGERALAVNKWVFDNVKFGYKLTRPNKTALDTAVERTGVCRDMMHLAVAFCRALNIPARYASGYLPDIDADPDPTPMDFSAFYEVYLNDRWWPMDARHARPRTGRVLMSRGRDAADTALLTTFGWHKLRKFEVITEPVTEPTRIAPLLFPLARSA